MTFPRTTAFIRDRRAYLKDTGEQLTFAVVRGFCQRLEGELLEEKAKNDSIAADHEVIREETRRYRVLYERLRRKDDWVAHIENVERERDQWKYLAQSQKAKLDAFLEGKSNAKENES